MVASSDENEVGGRRSEVGGVSEEPAFARYGAAVFARASEKPAFARYGAAVFARAKTGRVGGPPSHATARQSSIG